MITRIVVALVFAIFVGLYIGTFTDVSPVIRFALGAFAGSSISHVVMGMK